MERRAAEKKSTQAINQVWKVGLLKNQDDLVDVEAEDEVYCQAVDIYCCELKEGE